MGETGSTGREGPTASESAHAVARIYGGLSDDAKIVLQDIIKIERKYLHMGRPHGIVNEILAAVERGIR